MSKTPETCPSCGVAVSRHGTLCGEHNATQPWRPPTVATINGVECVARDHIDKLTRDLDEWKTEAQLMRQQFEEQGANAVSMAAQFGECSKDTRRLNWLEEQNACLRFDAEDDASLPQAVVFLPTLENGESTFRAAGHGGDFREAIDDAMRQMAKQLHADADAQLAEDLREESNQRMRDVRPPTLADE